MRRVLGRVRSRLGGLWRRHPRPLALAGALVATTAIGAWVRSGPLPAHLLELDAKPSLVIVDRHGVPLYEARSDLGTKGIRLAPSEIPPVLASATLAAEDTRFRAHLGLDPIGVLRAAWRDLRARRIREGGSTITQQTAKLLLARLHGGTVAHGWLAKLHEAVVALRLEHRLTKAEILALYLSVAPYGNQFEGASRASLAYFGHDVGALTPAEAAFLAALPQEPSRYNPWHDPAPARARASRILDTMAAHGWLSPADARVARAERVSLARETTSAVAPHFVAEVVTETAAEGARRVETTLDAGLEREVTGIIAERRATLEAHHADNVAVAVLDNRTGEWLAWEGSGNYADSAHGGTIDGVVTPRQPGSALKPFTYAAAFEDRFSPASVLADVPSQFPTDVPGVLYSPRNYDGDYRGPLLAREALAGSENVPAVVLASEVGVPTIARLLRRVGFSSLGDNAAYYGLGLTLGNAEVRLDEMVAAYAMLARGGVAVTPHAVRAMDGRPVPEGPAERVLSLRTAFWITDILSDNDARAYAFGRNGSLEFPFPVAAKTGTSTAYHDNWAIGYTREVTVGVWVGNFDRSPMRDSSGVTGAGPIFHDVMLAALDRVRGGLPLDDRDPIVPPTGNVRKTRICALSGLVAGDACPVTTVEWLPTDRPLAECTWHHATDEGLVTVWPAAYRDWARGAGLLGAALTGPPSLGLPASAVHTTSDALTIVAPLAGAVYLYDPTLRRQFQTLALRSTGGSPGARSWSVDGAPLGSARDGDALRWPLMTGAHVFTVRDASGKSASTTVTVR